MKDEYNAFLKNNTWVLVIPLLNRNFISSKWIWLMKKIKIEALDKGKSKVIA